MQCFDYSKYRSVLGTRSVIGPGPIKSRSVIDTRLVIGPFTLCNALIIQVPVSNWYVIEPGLIKSRSIIGILRNSARSIQVSVSNWSIDRNWRRWKAHSIPQRRIWLWYESDTIDAVFMRGLDNLTSQVYLSYFSYSKPIVTSLYRDFPIFFSINAKI